MSTLAEKAFGQQTPQRFGLRRWGVIFFCLSLLAVGTANATDISILDSIVRSFGQSAPHWQAVMLTWAERIFWPLATISVVWKMMQAWSMGTDIKGFFQELFWPLFFVALYYMLLVNGAAIGEAILNSAMAIGIEATGDARIYMPSQVIELAFETWEQVWSVGDAIFSKTFTFRNIAGSLINPAENNEYGMPTLVAIVYYIISFGVWILLVTIAIDLMIVLMGCWVLLYGGLLILAFGGGFAYGLSDKAKNYFQSMIAMAMRLIALALLIGGGCALIENQTQTMQMFINQDRIPTLPDAMMLLVSVMAFKLITTQVPDLLVGMINGQIGVMSNRGEGIVAGVISGGMAATGAVAAGAMAAAKIPGMIAGQMAAGQAQQQLQKVQDALKVKSDKPVGSGLGNSIGGMPGSVGSQFTGDRVSGGTTGTDVHGSQETGYSSATGTTSGKNINSYGSEGSHPSYNPFTSDSESSGVESQVQDSGSHSASVGSPTSNNSTSVSNLDTQPQFSGKNYGSDSGLAGISTNTQTSQQVQSVQNSDEAGSGSVGNLFTGNRLAGGASSGTEGKTAVPGSLATGYSSATGTTGGKNLNSHGSEGGSSSFNPFAPDSQSGGAGSQAQDSGSQSSSDAPQSSQDAPSAPDVGTQPQSGAENPMAFDSQKLMENFAKAGGIAAGLGGASTSGVTGSQMFGKPSFMDPMSNRGKQPPMSERAQSSELNFKNMSREDLQKMEKDLQGEIQKQQDRVSGLKSAMKSDFVKGFASTTRFIDIMRRL